LILIIYFLRTKLLMLDVCSVQGIIAICLFCVVRLLLPIELPWTKVVKGGVVWNQFLNFMKFEMIQIGHITVNIGFLLALVWAVGAIYKLVNILVNYGRLIRYVQNITKHGVRCELDGCIGINVYKSHLVSTPCAVGIIKRKILLPDQEYSKQQFEYILMHENEHHKNGDILVKMLINILCALYWWNPCVYLLKKEINQSLEIRCDQSVTRCLSNEEKVAYLSVILEEFKNSVYRKVPKYEYMMEIAGKEEHALVERFQLVASVNPKNIHWKRLALAGMLIVLFMSSYSFVIQSSFDVPEAEIEEGSYFIDSSNSYILQREDGGYVLVTPNEIIDIDKEDLEFYEESGFSILYEEGIDEEKHH